MNDLIDTPTINPCRDSLTPECFTAFPKWAKMVLAIRLLFLLFPPKLSRYLFLISGIFPVDESYNLPLWVFTYPDGYYIPDTITTDEALETSSEETSTTLTPPGKTYPFPAQSTTKTKTKTLKKVTPPVATISTDLPTWTISENTPIPDYDWTPELDTEISDVALTDEDSIIGASSPWLWPTPGGSPRTYSQEFIESGDETLLYYEPFQGPQLCTQQELRWYIDFYFPRRATTCPSLPLDHSYYEPLTGNTNRIRMSHEDSILKTIVNSGGGDWTVDQEVYWAITDVLIASNLPPYKMFKILFDASISNESWDFGSWLVLHIRKSGPPNSLDLHFVLAVAANFSGDFPADDENDIYIDWTGKSGSEQEVYLLDWYPGEGHAVTKFYFKADIAGGATMNFDLHYFDLYM